MEGQPQGTATAARPTHEATRAWGGAPDLPVGAAGVGVNVDVLGGRMVYRTGRERIKSILWGGLLGLLGLLIVVAGYYFGQLLAS